MDIKTIKVKIFNHHSVKQIENVEKISISTEEGPICITPNHSNIITKITQGSMLFVSNGQLTNIDMSDGIMNFFNGVCEIILKHQ